MRTLFARCTMLALLVGGFSLTGDTGWIVHQGQNLLNATTVPAAPEPHATFAPPLLDKASDYASQATPSVTPSSAMAPVPNPVDVQFTPSLAAPAERPPIGGGEAVIDLRLLRPGDRLRLWINGTVVTFDMVDPRNGEAIQQPITRRVQIGGTREAPRIERGGMVTVQPQPGVSGYVPPAEVVGPVQAIHL